MLEPVEQSLLSETLTLARRGAERFGVALAAAGLAASGAGPAHAKPQWNAGLESGVTRSQLERPAWGWGNAVHADVLFLRERSTDIGIGPSLRVGSIDFDDLRTNAGVSLLLPIFESFPLVLETGPHLRNFAQPGVFGSIFFGLRSFNHYGHYEMAGGLSLTAEHSFLAGSPSALWLTARVDAAWIALPFVLLTNALR